MNHPARSPRSVFKHALVAWSSAAVLCAAAVPGAHAQGLFGRGEPGVMDANVSAGPEQYAPALVVTDGTQSFQKHKTAVVTNFRVIVITEGNGSARSNTGIGSSPYDSKATSTLNVVWTLANLPEPKLQAMVDGLYAQFQNDLKAAGWNLVSLDRLTGTEGAQLLANKEPLKTVQVVKTSKDNQALMLTPRGLPIKAPAEYTPVVEGASSGMSLGSLGGLGGALKGLNQFSKVSEMMELQSLAKKTDLSMFDVTVVVDFVDLQGNGKSWLDRLGGNRAQVRSRVAPTITSGGTGMAMISPSGMATVRLDRAIALPSDETIADTKEVTTSSDRAAAATTLLVTGLMSLGTGGKTGVVVSETKRWEAQASDNYPHTVGRYTQQLTRAMVQATQR